MTAYETELFSMNDVNRLRILQDVIDRRLTTRLAASRLEISDRYCRRLLERYREHGQLSLRGRPGNRQLIPGLAERALFRCPSQPWLRLKPNLCFQSRAGIYMTALPILKVCREADVSFGCHTNANAAFELSNIIHGANLRCRSIDYGFSSSTLIPPVQLNERLNFHICGL